MISPTGRLPNAPTTFHTYASLVSELQNLSRDHPSLVTVTSIGSSWETTQGLANRSLFAAEVSVPGGTKKDVLFMGLHHAEEWISLEVVVYLLRYVLLNAGNDSRVDAILARANLWFVPLVNPDGLEYARLNDSTWRKNRRDNGDGTFGVDLNRNYGFVWGLNSGSSPNTNDDTYRGPSPFSEPEVAAFRDFVAARHNPKAMLTYHTFTEQFLRPWSYATSDPPGKPTLEYIVQDSIARIDAVHGESYGESIGYLSSGEATDYFWNQYRMAAFTPEMRPATGGLDGFSPPASQIIPNNEENLPAAL